MIRALEEFDSVSWTQGRAIVVLGRRHIRRIFVAVMQMAEEDPTVPTASGLVAQNSECDRDMNSPNSAVVVVAPDTAVPGFNAVPCDADGIRVQSYEQRCVPLCV